MTKTQNTLSTTTRFFHWTIGLLIIGMLVFGTYIENLPRGPEKGTYIRLHASLGLAIFVLASMRILWRMKEGFPQKLTKDSKWQNTLATTIHIVLLTGTVLMPISGIVMNVAGGSGLSFFGIELLASQRNNPDFTVNKTMRNMGGAIHAIGGKLMIGAIILHLAGALKHHFVDRDQTLRRMLGIFGSK